MARDIMFYAPMMWKLQLLNVFDWFDLTASAPNLMCTSYLQVCYNGIDMS